MAKKPTKPTATDEEVKAVGTASDAPVVVTEKAAVTGEAKPAQPRTKQPAKPKSAPAKAAEEDDDDDEDEEEDDEEEEEEEEEHPVFTAKEAYSAFANLFRFVWPHLIRYPKWLLIVATGLLIETAFNVAFPLSLKYLIDDVLQSESDSDGAYSKLIFILTTLGVAGIVVSIVTIWYEYYDSVLISTAMADIRQKLFGHLQTLSAAFYSRTKVGTITSRYGSDLTQVDEAMTHMVTWGMLPFLELLAGIGLMFYLNWQMGLVAMFLFPIALIGPRLLSGPAVDASYQERKAAASVVAVVQENISAQNVVKAFSLRRIAMGWFNDRNMVERKHAIRSRFINAMVERSITISVLLLHLVVFGLGAYLTYNDHITLGTFITFESVFWELSYNLGHVTQFIPVAIGGAGATKHINDLFNEPMRGQDPEDAPEVPRIRQAITFTNVDFSYGGPQKQIEALNLTIPAGARVAIVGPSGSGKSTVLNLLLRLYDPTSGTIRIDETDIVHAKRDSLRAQMAVVFQDNILFDISIRENIRLGNPGASDLDVVNAAKAAEIHRFIRSLPHGYDTVVGERGNMMSGGQRQRIAIARAIVRDPAILLLDEATSALDHGTEQAINKTLMKVARGRTMITVTHRLHSVTEMDTIHVLERGRLIETGTHGELLKRKGVYAQLFKRGG